MLKMFMKSKKGFTLVELMVVVVIIGILTVIAIPVFNAVSDNAEKGACHANLRTIEGMKLQWNMMSASERPDAFGKMFEGNAVPDCPGDGDYDHTDPAETDRAECSVHGTY